MLKLEQPSQIKSLKLSHIHCTIGVFDGVHLGHQRLINHVVQSAKENKGTSIVITFDKHPYNIINPSIHIPILTLPDQKLYLLESLGVDICILIKFNKAVAEIPAETWIKEVLWNEMHIETIHMGDDTFFGKDQKGDINMLTHWSRQLGFKVIKIDMMRTDKTQISSTAIRNLILKGDFKNTEKLLGRPYSVLGKHINGRGLGKELGFPTINLDTSNQCLPPNGIYTVYINKDIPAVANLGISPTFGFNTKPLLEVHILSDRMPDDQSNIEVQFIEKLRDEIKFQSIPALIEQIKKDTEQAKKTFFSL
jgi:riboflavin kinase/FMN adenylyltransferase